MHVDNFSPEVYILLMDQTELNLDVSNGILGGHKTYYSIREVCEQTSLEPHVLRYWESEFPQLRPKKNRAGNRAYRDKDIEIIFAIKRLLYEEQFTIPGAKKKLAEEKSSKAGPDLDAEETSPVAHPSPVSSEVKQDTIKELHKILKVLAS
jgi:DNA-binding transcriptional MerR regulator